MKQGQAIPLGLRFSCNVFVVRRDWEHLECGDLSPLWSAAKPFFFCRVFFRVKESRCAAGESGDESPHSKSTKSFYGMPGIRQKQRLAVFCDAELFDDALCFFRQQEFGEATSGGDSRLWMFRRIDEHHGIIVSQ